MSTSAALSLAVPLGVNCQPPCCASPGVLYQINVLIAQHDMGHCTVASVPKAMFYLDICQFRMVFFDGIFFFLGFCKLDVHEVFLF